MVLTRQRSTTPRFHQDTCGSLLWYLSRHHRLKREHSLRADMASQQHPRAMETRSLLRHTSWDGRHWWYHRLHSIQIPGRAELQAWYLCYNDRLGTDCCSCLCVECEVLASKQES